MDRKADRQAKKEGGNILGKEITTLSQQLTHNGAFECYPYSIDEDKMPLGVKRNILSGLKYENILEFPCESKYLDFTNSISNFIAFYLSLSQSQFLGGQHQSAGNGRGGPKGVFHTHTGSSPKVHLVSKNL